MPTRTALIRSLLVAALAAALGTTGAAPAHAGTYDVRSCSANSVGNPPTPVTGLDDAWTYETNDTTHFEQLDQCPPSDDTVIDGFGTQTRLNSASAPQGRFAHWRFDAPAGTTLIRLRLWRYAGKRTTDWELYTKTADGINLAGNDCVLPPDEFFCTVGGPGVMGDFAGLNTTSLRVGMACTFETSCSTGAMLHDAWSAIYSSIVTVNDPTAPTASGGTGSVFAGGYVHGTVNAGVSTASDTTGIRGLQVRSDGNVAETSADRSSCDFSRRAPCTNIAAPETFSFDSRAISDGTHTVQVGVLDAGHNFTAARTEQVTVDNTAPVAPTPTSATSVMTQAAATAISWAEPGGQIAPIVAAHVTVCGPSGCQTTTQAAGGGSGSATVSLPAYGTYSVSVALEDAADNVNRAAAWSIARQAPPLTAAAPAAPASPAPSAAPHAPALVKTSPLLLIFRPAVSRDRRTITVRGTVASGVSGKVTVTASARIHGRTRTVTRKVAIRRRRYSVRLRLPSSAWRIAKVTVRYPGSATRRAATATRPVRRPR